MNDRGKSIDSIYTVPDIQRNKTKHNMYKYCPIVLDSSG